MRLSGDRDGGLKVAKRASNSISAPDISSLKKTSLPELTRRKPFPDIGTKSERSKLLRARSAISSMVGSEAGRSHLKQPNPRAASNIPDDVDWLKISTASWPKFRDIIMCEDMKLNPDPYYTRGWPYGSIFYRFSEEMAMEDLRLRKRSCPKDETSYYSRVRHFNEIQERRKFVPPNVFYELLRRNALKDEDLGRLARIERAGQMFLMHAMGALRINFIGWRDITQKHKKARRFLVRRMWGTQRSVLLSWCEIAQKYKRSRLMLTKHMGSHKRKSFIAWNEYVKKILHVKRLLQGHMQKLEQATFEAWATYVRKGKYICAKMSKHLVSAKRDRFMRWAKYAETSAKIKRLLGKHFIGIMRTTFVAWFMWTGKSIKAKRMFASQLVGLQKLMLLAWRRAVIEQVEEKRQRELWLANQKPQNFFASERFETPGHSIQQFPRSFSSPASNWRIY